MDPALTTSEVEGNKSAIPCINPRSRPYCSPSGGEEGNLTSIDSLPDALLFEILVRVSVLDINRNARLVCRRWKRLIHGDAFVSVHLHRASSGLLIGDCEGAPAIFVTSTQGGIEVSESIYFNGSLIYGSCDGLILGRDKSIENSVFILNPATNRGFYLPRFSDTKSGFIAEFCEFGIAYASASMEYKVVVTTYVEDSYPKSSQCAILTVGVGNAWRYIMIEQLSPRAKEFLLDYYDIILSTEGFVHWVSSRESYVLTMDVETETIAETPAPVELEAKRCRYLYFSTGRHLSLLISRGVLSWEVWEMKGETGEWRKAVNKIDLKAHKCQIPASYHKFVKPIGWVKYPDVLAFSFRRGRTCFLYNLDTDLIDSEKLDFPSKFYNVAVHRSSLVQFG